jgi:translation initiation factor 5B
MQYLPIGRVTGIEINHKTVESAKKGQDVAVKIELPEYEPAKMVGRHFEITDDIMSHVRTTEMRAHGERHMCAEVVRASG